MAAVKDGSDCKDPNKALAQIRKTMRVFRFELQQELAKVGHDAGKMDLPEEALRTIQHAFTFGVGSKVSETFARLLSLEARFDEALDGLLDRLRALDPANAVPEPPAGIRLADVVGDALELSHRTNERIRDFQVAAATESTLRGIVGPLVEKGGSRKVEFTVFVEIKEFAKFWMILIKIIYETTMVFGHTDFLPYKEDFLAEKPALLICGLLFYQ